MSKSYNNRHMKMLTGAYGLPREDAEAVMNISGKNKKLMFETAQLVKDFSINPTDAKKAVNLLGLSNAKKATDYFLSGQREFKNYGSFLEKVTYLIEQSKPSLFETEVSEKTKLVDPAKLEQDSCEPDIIQLFQDPEFVNSLTSRIDRISERKDPVNPENLE